MRIIVSGPAAIFDEAGQEIRDWQRLLHLDGFPLVGESIANHFDHTLDHIRGGDSCLKLDRDSKSIRVHTEFRSRRKLNTSELDYLVQQTKAQWSDGIGEDAHLPRHGGGSISLYPLPYDDTLVQVSQINEAIVVRIFKLVSHAIERIAEMAGGGIDREGKWGMTRLMQAAADGDAERLIHYIGKKANLHHRGEGGRTSLTMAVMHGHHRIVELLLDAGANPDDADDQGMSAVIWAANRGYMTIIDSPVARSANLDSRNTKGESALFYTQRLNVTEHLLALGADPCLQDLSGNTAADHARMQAEAFRTHRNWPRPERVAFEEAKAEMPERACLIKKSG